MNIRRFVAPNSRAALREVRQVLGGDAVIISNRPTPDGVEILAAAAGELSRLADGSHTTRREASAVETKPAGVLRTEGFDPLTGAKPREEAGKSGAPEWMTEAQVVRTRKRIATLLENSGEFDSQQLDEQGLFSAEQTPDVVANLGAARAPKMPKVQPIKPPPLSTMQSELNQESARASAGVAALAAGPSALSAAAHVPLIAAIQNAARDLAPTVPLNATGQLADEMRSMRSFIEEQLANFAWSEAVRRQPGRMRLMQDLIAAGFSASLSRHLQQNLPDDFTHNQGRNWASEVLERNLTCASAQTDLTDQGGVFALVGPTGVGKTTTAAKLAARFALKHGADQLALITTDAYRIGAQDQLRIYGKILGIPVQTIHDQASLSSALEYLGRKKLVLIDTAGLGQRDERVAEQFAMLRGTRAKRLLVLNSTIQAETLEEVVCAYAERGFNGCVITKIDEAVRLGAVLDVVVRHRLKIQYVSNGQRVPEDLHHPNPKYLIHRALREKASKVFDFEPEDHPAWLAAIAQSARAVTTKQANHV